MKIIECPRDAMQGIEKFIPSQQKIEYIQQLLQVGFDTLDCGSFVSPKAIPQMRDTAEIFSRLHNTTATKLLVIVANVRGAREACVFDAIDYLGYPLSLSEIFQQRNTQRSVAAAFDDLADIQNMCKKAKKELVVYLSMGFGNPYGEPYTVDTVAQYIARLASLEVTTISLADTIGVATCDTITHLFEDLAKSFSSLELGVHLHAAPASSKIKIEAAYKAGCRRFDGALGGWGGCPMANNKLVGNIATETILDYLNSENVSLPINAQALSQALQMTPLIFGSPKR